MNYLYHLYNSNNKQFDSYLKDKDTLQNPCRSLYNYLNFLLVFCRI